jgi:hypothetical protein
MPAQGITQVNFGAAPGATIAAVTTVNASGIQAGSIVEAWLYPQPTTDHSADEHITAAPNISLIAGNVNAAAQSFQIFAQVLNQSLPEYGQYSVAWVWS